MKVVLLLSLLVLTGCKQRETAVVITRTTPTETTAGVQILPSDFVGRFDANSTTAMGITGDAMLSSNSISIDEKTYKLDSIQPITASEASAVNSLVVVSGTPQQSFIARIHVPAATKFVNENTLCGREDTTWIVGLAKDSATMGLVMFSGQPRPVLTVEALNNSHDVCGTYGYSRKG